MDDDTTDPLIRLRDITVSFSGVQVVKGVSLDIFPAEVLCLAGENGAGKSTLMRVLAGVHPPTKGSIEIDGDVTSVSTVTQARQLGIAIIHQELALAPDLTVAENLSLGSEPRRRWGLTLDRMRMVDRARAALQVVGADFAPDREVSTLSIGQQQLVEIARALAEKPRVLILDEPTAALSHSEEQRLLGIVARLREQGISILYITHRMTEIQQLADRVAILRDGALVTTLPIKAAAPERIVELMVGRPVDALFAHQPTPTTSCVVEARQLRNNVVTDFNVRVNAGEIVGIAGLIGAGRTEAMRLIAGIDRRAGGTVTLAGTPFAPATPREAIRAGVVLLPESRKEQGLLLDRSILENICVSTLHQLTRGGVLSRAKMLARASTYVEQLNIKCTSVHQPVSELSGGNQQKVLLARCLVHEPRLLILDEPTRGVDVGAKADIYAAISACANAGAAVLVVSSELPEVLGLSHRVVVMRAGRVAATLPASGLTEEIVMGYATGVTSSTTSSPTPVLARIKEPS